MTDGLADHGSDQFGGFDMKRVNDALANGKSLDPNEILMLPIVRKDSLKDMHVFVPMVWVDGIDAIVQAKHFKDRTDFIREAIAHRLAWFGEHMDMFKCHPITIAAKLESDRVSRELVDKTIYEAKLWELDGDRDREELREDLMSLMEYCKKRGWGKRVESIREVLMRLVPYGFE